MIPAGTRRAAPERPTFDLSGKTALVPRAGFWSRGAGLRLRLAVTRFAGLLWRQAGWLISAGVALQLFTGAFEARSPVAWALLALGAALFLQRLVVRVRGGTRALPAAFEESALAVTGVYGLLALSGGLDSPAYPLLYLVTALLVAYHRPAVGIGAAALALALELAVAWKGGHLGTHATVVAAHGVFLVAFGIVYHLALSANVALARRAVREAIARHIGEIHRRAREYRLIVPTGEETVTGSEAAERWAVAAVDEIGDAVQAVLEMVHAALDARTVALFLLSPDEELLRLRACLSDSEQIRRRPLPAGQGLPGVVLRRRGPVRLCGDFRGAVYDQSKGPPRAFLGVPLLERRPGSEEAGEGYLRGVLLADRAEARPFDERDEQVLTVAACQVMRAIETERVMGYLRKEKDEKGRFYRAIEHLNLLSKPGEVAEAVTRLATALAPVEFAAVTLVYEAETDDEPCRHRIVHAVGPGSKPLEGAVFSDNSGLVASAVRLGSTLPGRDFHQMERTVVFHENLPLRDLETLKVLPMNAGETVVGTLVVGSARRQALGADATRMLEVLAMQAAGAIQRARLFEKTERMATTDGLTGLNNHRRFQELFETHLAAARRYGREVSLLLMDVDHFKSVNDTYGHPVGDKVLKGVAKVLAAQARDTDVVARYGGEEFAVVLPETGQEGAVVIANRIREEIARQVFSTELGPLKVTLSIGVATCPVHGDQKQALVDRADQALYEAKRGGRNRVVVARAGAQPPARASA
ncbi:MAG: diguanylate cyclase [Deltaproteobacteria bacterium]|nr:MAG: diguanylate cyclase [Deltaproteobacteria bacterium]